MFWGSNRACVGAICFTGFWLAILLWLYCKEHNWRRNALILAILMIMGLIGSWSRSDFAALFVSFILFILISKKKIGFKAKKIGFIVFALIFNLWAIITILDINIEFPTLERFSVLLSEKWHEEGTGKYRIEMQKSIINYLLDNKEILLIGKGANGFRSLYGNEGIWSNAAHNTFLHNLTELGIVGFFLIMLFFYRILRLARFYSLDIISIIFPILVSFILGRFISGYATDSFFAVDAMLPANIMLFGFIAVTISNIRFPYKKEIE
jgi:O-antigen ligase